MPGAFRDQKRMSDPLELQLTQTMMSHVDIGDQTYVLWKRSQCFKPLSYLSSTPVS